MRPTKQAKNMASRSEQIVAAVVEQSYKDLTRPAEDKNPLTGVSSHLCTCVLNMRYPRSFLCTRQILIRGKRRERGIQMAWEGGRGPISIPILVWVSRSAVTPSAARPRGPLGRVEINQKTLCSPHPCPIPHAPLFHPPTCAVGPLSLPSQLRIDRRLLFSFQSHFMSGEIDTRDGSDGNGSAKMARAESLELTD